MTAFTEESFKKINGYSNEYWGWGGEDDDISHRMYDVYRLGFTQSWHGLSTGGTKLELVQNKKTPHPPRTSVSKHLKVLDR